MNLSTYQKNILDEVSLTNNNILVDAKAGSGKTTTLIEIANKIQEQNKKCLFLAFNKSIVSTLEKKLNGNTNCVIKTIHSLGYTFLRSYLYKVHKNNYDIVIGDEKVKAMIAEKVNTHSTELLKDYMENELDIEQQRDKQKTLSNLIYEIKQQIYNITNLSRLRNVNYHNPDMIKDMIMELSIELKNIFEKDRKEKYKYFNIPLIVEECIDQVKKDFEEPGRDESGKYIYNIDFVDMLYFPVYYDMSIPYSIINYLDYVLVDESQDLSVLQQKFISRLGNVYQSRKNTRFIFVGDEKQAIYYFAGADSNSIKVLQREFTLRKLPLNICYRCPETIIKLAQTIVPDIEWNKEREDKGKIELYNFGEYKDIVKPKDIVVTRGNSNIVNILIDLRIDKRTTCNII